MKPLYICVAVWGIDYVKTFEKYCLASILSDDNLPKIANLSEEIQFFIYTDKNSLSHLLNSRLISKLKNYCDLHFYIVSGYSVIGNYRAMNDCHRHFLQKSVDRDVIIICPDMIFSKNALKIVYDKYKTTGKPICINTPRLDKETFLTKYEQILEKNGSYLNNDELTQLGLSCLHEETLAKVFNKIDNLSVDVGGFYIQDEKGLIGCQFHLYPIIFNVCSDTILPELTIDNDFLDKNYTEVDSIEVMPNSLDCCIVDVTSQGSIELVYEPLTVNKLANWAEIHARPIHRALFTSILQFRTEISSDCDDSFEQTRRLHNEVKRLIVRDYNYTQKRSKKYKFNRLSEIWENNSSRDLSRKLIAKLYNVIFKKLKIRALKQN